MSLFEYRLLCRDICHDIVCVHFIDNDLAKQERIVGATLRPTRYNVCFSSRSIRHHSDMSASDDELIAAAIMDATSGKSNLFQLFSEICLHNIQSAG